MKQANCSTWDCQREVSARGLCSVCYVQVWRAGLLDEITPPVKQKHMISDVDSEARTGVCEICGPVSVKYKSHRNYYECGTLTERYKKAYKAKPLSIEARRRQRLKSKYGLTGDQYEQMYATANGSCEICQVELPLLHVDHDHNTGEVRGLLCPPCNKGLGHFKDNPAALASALEYLARAKMGATA